ncbi:hypothetical protein GGF42_003012 [Coemansia sp. RSA 2424]|nr:hypothetical protein GGF42_003012 [Coemansia sp. RSA 2424]
MSFEFTPDEQRRVALAQLAGIKLDPIGHADLAVVATLGTVYFIDFIAVAFLLWNRKYAPLKSKYPILMSCCLLSMFIWFLGDLVLKSHVHVRGVVLSSCMFFCVWMRVMFGCFMVSGLITIRSYALFCIFRKNCAFRGQYVYWSWSAVGALALVFVLVTYIMPREHTVHYIPLVQMCNMGYTYRAIVQSLLWLTWTVNALINYRLRNITSSFNESREMGVACISVFLLLTFNTVILYAYPMYPTRTSLRVTETLLSHTLANFLWWFIMYESIFNCAFRRKLYLVRWKDKLVRDGLQKQYQISRTVDPFSATMMSVDSGNPAAAKHITLPRDVIESSSSPRGFETRMSFSRHSGHRQESTTHGVLGGGGGVSAMAAGGGSSSGRMWYASSTDNNGNNANGSSSLLSTEDLAAAEDDNSNIMLFSPARADSRPLNNLENISSATTIHDDNSNGGGSSSSGGGGTPLSRYHFPAPPKSSMANADSD